MTAWEVIIVVREYPNGPTLAITSKYLVSERSVVKDDERAAIYELVNSASKALEPMALNKDPS